MIVHAHLRQAGTGQRDAPPSASRQVQVDAATYQEGRDQITREIPDGWIVASWRVERTP